MPELKNKPSRSYHLARCSFWASIVFVFIGLFQEIDIGAVHFKITPVSPEIILFLLAPCLGLYGFRRYTDFLTQKHNKREE